MKTLPSKSPRKWATAAAAACAAGLSIVPSAKADIGNFSKEGVGATDWTLNRAAANPAGVPSITSNVLNITTAAGSEASSAWFNTAQQLSNFTASFTYDFLNGGAPPADGFAFVLQNSGLSALGGGGGALGYLGIDKSVALGFDLYSGGAATANGNTAFSAQSSQYGSYPGFNNYASVSPVALRDAANTVNVNIAYREGVFTETLSQVVAGTTNTYTRTAFYNVADRVGPTGFVGFTGGTGGAIAAQNLSNFSYTTGNAPAVAPAAVALTGVPQGGPGFFGIREVRGAAGCCGDLTQAQAAILANSGTGGQVDYTAPVLNLYDSDVHGRFTNNESLYKLDPNQTAGSSDDTVDNIAVIATGTVRIPTTGMYTFGSNSDDGFRLIIVGNGLRRPSASLQVMVSMQTARLNSRTVAAGQIPH